jgi:tryptophan-rich sensory protein
MKQKLIHILEIFLPLIVGGIISLIIKSYMEYSNLIKPILSPPNWLFPLSWSIIYLLMGISYYLFKKNSYDKKITIIYYIQLFVNALWSIIFFAWKLYFLSIIWIILLDILVLIMLILFYKYNKVSTYLNIPYIIWILFATYLTIGIYLLN